MENAVLLVGNDINNATESYSWEALIKGLLQHVKAEHSVNQDNKPFPLLYEEIYLYALKNHRFKEKEIKKFIANNTSKMQSNELHSAILDLGIENIFTTNYDLSFERAAGMDTKNCTNKGYLAETRYNLFRYHQTKTSKIWHIHGSQTVINSITLGYEQYGGYLQQMRNYVATGTGKNYKKKEFSPIRKRIENGTLNYESWVDFFFTHDVFIFGLNLDFVEIHLWWLLNYRGRVLAENRFPVTNRIYYFYPDKYKSTSLHKIAMFKANGVIPISESYYSTSKLSYYQQIINGLSERVYYKSKHH